MIIKKSKVFRYCSYGYLVLWTFIFIAGICSRIVDIETSKEKIIFSIVMSVILIPIVLCSLRIHKRFPGDYKVKESHI